MSFFDRFRRKPEPPRYTPPSGDGRVYGQWAIGDLAVCISRNDGWFDWATGEPSPAYPLNGEVYLVTGVCFFAGYHSLFLAGLQGAFTASCFRKAQLNHDEACEPEFVDLLKRIKKTRRVDA